MLRKHFNKSFRLPKLTLRMGGIYLNYPKNMNRKEYFKWSAFFYFNMLVLCTDIIGEVVWLVNGSRNGKGFIELTFNAPCVLFSILGCCKMYELFCNKHILTYLFTKLEDLFPDDSCDENIVAILKSSTRLLNPIVNITFYLNCVLVWLFNLLPLAKMVMRYHRSEDVELLLPYLISYPFNQFDVRIWPIIYMRQMWDGVFTTIGIVGPDTFYYACCSHIRMHFRILQYNMERSVAQAVAPSARSELRFMDQPPKVEPFKMDTIKVDNEYLRRHFVELIKKHQELIGLVQQLEQLYSRSTLINFGSSSILICLTGFNVTAIDTSQLPVFIVFLVSCLSQIYVFCLFGDMIKESSMQVSSAIYCSHWYLADNSIKRTMHFSLLRAQRACKLTAYNFADVNLHSFTRVLSTSWSYFALLNTVYYNPGTAKK